jgi:hypothetical protein
VGRTRRPIRIQPCHHLQLGNAAPVGLKRTGVMQNNTSLHHAEGHRVKQTIVVYFGVRVVSHQKGQEFEGRSLSRKSDAKLLSSKFEPQSFQFYSDSQKFSRFWRG